MALQIRIKLQATRIDLIVMLDCANGDEDDYCWTRKSWLRQELHNIIIYLASLKNMILLQLYKVDCMTLNWKILINVLTNQTKSNKTVSDFRKICSRRVSLLGWRMCQEEPPRCLYQGQSFYILDRGNDAEDGTTVIQ